MVCNTAIFYDIENLVGLLGAKTNSNLHLDEIYKKVLELESVSGISIQRAYADWASPAIRNLRSSVLEIGIEPIQIFTTNHYDKVKNAADVSLIIDAVDLIAKRPDIENFVIASGDGIFAFLSRKLHEHGKRVIGCSFNSITSSVFRNSCDFFIDLEETGEVQKKAEKPVVAQEQKKTTFPKRFPKTKYSEALQKSGLVILKDTSDTVSCLHAARQLVDALFVDYTKDMPPLEVSVFTNYLSHYLPKFKVRRHGFKRINEFVRLLITKSPYCVSTEVENVLLLSPRTAAKGTVLQDMHGLVITGSDGTVYNSIFDVPPGEIFSYKTVPVTKEEKPKNGRFRKRNLPAPPQIDVGGSIRKYVKDRFEQLSKNDSLSLVEVKKLTTADYSRQTFSVRVPVLKEIETRQNIDEQRKVNGKVLYWKESFKFNGRTYLVFKEWIVHLHKNKFAVWSNGLDK